MNDIQNLLSLGTTITLSNGREQKVVPLKFRQFGEVSAILKKINVNVMDEDVDIMSLVAGHHVEVADILVIALGWAREEVEGLYMDDLAKIILTVIEVNGNFFAQRMLPALEELKQMKSHGQS